MTKTLRARAALICLIGGFWVSVLPSAYGQGDTVVARVDGEAITLADVKATKAMLPAQVQGAPLEEVFDIIVNILIDSKLAARDALKRGLDKDVDVARQLTRVREQILERAALTRHIDQQITEGMIVDRYQKIVGSAKGQKERRISHILLKDRTDADAVIAELKGGADFAELAKTRSVGPSAPKGGDIGFIGRGDTVAPFEAAAFALKPGAYSDAPVETQFGWHVILAGETRDKVPPALDTMRDRLVASLSREIGLDYVRGLRNGIAIERFDVNGKPQE